MGELGGFHERLLRGERTGRQLGPAPWCLLAATSGLALGFRVLRHTQGWGGDNCSSSSFLGSPRGRADLSTLCCQALGPYIAPGKQGPWSLPCPWQDPRAFPPLPWPWNHSNNFPHHLRNTYYVLALCQPCRFLLPDFPGAITITILQQRNQHTDC